MDWLTDANTLSAIGSLGAVVIALAALYFSHRGQSAQRLREQREELRGVLERLVTIREEQAELIKEREESVKTAAGIWQQTKRMMYLEAAESLSRQLLPHLTASEISIVAMENYYDGDWLEARRWYQLAEGRSEHTSPLKRAELLRALASTYYINDPALLDPATGADAYRRAVGAVDGRIDIFASYTRALGYRGWAASELSVQRLDEAADLFDRAWQEWQKIPGNEVVRWLGDVRNLAFSGGFLGAAWFKSAEDGAHARGRAAFAMALDITGALADRYGSTGDYTLETRGLICQWWAQSELIAGDGERSTELFERAHEAFDSLSDEFPWRDFRLGELQLAKATGAPAPSEPAPNDPQRVAGADDVTPVR